MFSKFIYALAALLLTVALATPAYAVTHHKHKSNRLAGLSKIVSDTRLPPCTVCSACHSQLDKSVCANAKTHKYKKFKAVATWYGPGFHGRKTASGERFNQHAMTAAHRTLPLGTRVHVRNLDNNMAVVVTINDRGPFVRGRDIDLSRGAARAIHMAGTERVEITILG